MTTQHPSPRDSDGASPGLDRRTAVLAGVGLTVGLPLLAACGDGSTAAPEATSEASDAPTRSPAADATRLADTADVPVGGGLIVSGVVLSQPTQGAFRAFSGICTHQSCPVTEITETIDCTCHFSKFSLVDGSVVQGPATKRLAPIEVVVDGDAIYRT